MDGASVGIGLIGLGAISYAHERGYVESGRAYIAGVCDVRPEVAQERAAALHCLAYTDYRALLRDPAVQAVDITLPHNLHFTVAQAALEHGKHVLIEKPMAGTSAECRTLIATATRHGLTFTVAENTRFVTAYVAAERLLRAGEIGEIRLIRTFIYGSEVERLRDTSLWKGRRDGTLGGAIFDAGPHSFYLLKWLCGEIAGVQAFQNRLVRESEVEDHGIVAGQMRNGALFTTEFSFTAEIPWGERCEIYGSKGSLIIDQLHNPPAVHYHGAADFAGAVLDMIPYEPQDWKCHSISAGVQDFVAALTEGRATGVDPLDGLYTLMVAEAAYQSIARSGSYVELPCL